MIISSPLSGVAWTTPYPSEPHHTLSPLHIPPVAVATDSEKLIQILNCLAASHLQPLKAEVIDGRLILKLLRPSLGPQLDHWEPKSLIRVPVGSFICKSRLVAFRMSEAFAKPRQVKILCSIVSMVAPTFCILRQSTGENGRTVQYST
jgi:hypothetical protein